MGPKERNCTGIETSSKTTGVRPGLNSITFVKQLLAEIKEVVHYNTSLSEKTEQDKKNKDA